MGLRFRKSIKLGKGVKLNLNKKSFGVTVGGKGAHYSINSKGRRTATVGIPGTGLSYTSSSKSGSKRKASSTTHTVVPKKEMKTGLIPMILTVLFGWTGAHWFFSGRIGKGFLYLFTCGLFFIGWFVDSITQIIAFVKLYNSAKEEMQSEKDQETRSFE